MVWCRADMHGHSSAASHGAGRSGTVLVTVVWCCADMHGHSSGASSKVLLLHGGPGLPE